MENWGIQVQSVEIRDVIIPSALEDAMSRQALAERERQARIILGTAETEIAHKFVEAADAYRDHPTAMTLRAMNMLYESIVKRGSLMVVPSALADSLNAPSIMGMMGAARFVPPQSLEDGLEARDTADTAPNAAGKDGARATEGAAAPRSVRQHPT
jgi:hypothetical protein